MSFSLDFAFKVYTHFLTLSFCPVLWDYINEHVSKKSLKTDLEGNFVLNIEGGILQDIDNSGKSSFNLIQFDLEKKLYRIENNNWENEYYSNTIEDKSWHSCKNQFLKEYDKLSFATNHNEWLTDIGASYTHPLKSNLNLTDVYIFPNLRELKESLKKEDSNGVISFEKVFSELNDNRKNLIIGGEKAGKTTLCKVVIQDLYKRGFYPIYIRGRKINQTNYTEFRKHIKSSFYEQYQKFKDKDFDQISEDKIYLIIDNFDRASINTKFKNKLIREITQAHENILITGNDLLTIQEILVDDSSENVFSQYKQYTILEFGHLLRHQLVNRWNTLGRIELIEDEQLARKNLDAERIIDSIIGPNFIPSYPIFLLTILQTIEAGSPHDLKESSYGHYYQVLILSSLGNIVKQNDEIEKYYTYLAELAYYFLKLKSNEISNKEFEDFHEYHYQEYKMKMNVEDTLSVLVKASIIDRYDDSIAFKYRYVYYFFVSKYLSDNLSQPKERAIIKKMCRRLHETHCANIILFLTHHSKDAFILSEIASVAREQFSEFDIVRFENDVDSFNILIESIPQIAYENKASEEHREEILKQKDESDSHNNNDDVFKPIDLDNNTIDELDLISRLNGAFKTLEILGQVLKNHYASIKAIKKVELIEEAYYIGLRTLNSFFKVFEDSNEFMIHQINEYLDKNNIKNDKFKAQDVGRQLVFNLGCHVTYNFIRKITSSIGTSKLKDIYVDVVRKNSYNSVFVIDFAIKLEYFNGFPLNDLKTLKEKFKSNPLAYVVMRRIVIDYLYMFPISIARKQQISSILDISINAQRRIDGKSVVRRRK